MKKIKETMLVVCLIMALLLVGCTQGGQGTQATNGSQQPSAANTSGNVAPQLPKDTTPPAISITPVANVSNESEITVGGKTENGARVTIDGNSVAVAGDGAFSAKINLTKGNNTVFIAATDAAGNKNETSFAVEYKPPPVKPTIENATDIWNSTIAMSATVGDKIGLNADNTSLVFGGMPPGSASTKRVELTNYQDKPVLVMTSFDGELAQWTTAPTDFVIDGFQTVPIDVVLSVPRNATYGSYNGTLTLSFYRD